MPRVRAILPQVNTYPCVRPSQCPYCGFGILHRHGKFQKRVKNIYKDEVMAMRYCYVGYGRAFTHYLQGVDSSGHSVRIRVLGLSHRSVGCVLTVARILCVYDDRLEGCLRGWQGYGARQERAHGGQNASDGADETIVKVRGKAKLVGFVADAESGELLGIDILVERDSDGFSEWLKGYVERLGVKDVVPDDLSTYKPVVDGLGLEYQVCVVHVRKNAARRLRKMKG